MCSCINKNLASTIRPHPHPQTIMKVSDEVFMPAKLCWAVEPKQEPNCVATFWNPNDGSNCETVMINLLVSTGREVDTREHEN